MVYKSNTDYWNQCEITSDAKENILSHLGEHGVLSLLSSHKFSPYFTCIIKALGEGMTGVSNSNDDGDQSNDGGNSPITGSLGISTSSSGSNDETGLTQETEINVV